MDITKVKLKLYSNWNNYYNRKVKTAIPTSDPSVILTGTNFNPNDGINTTHKVTGEISADCDYLFVVDEEDKVVSRWFILELKRLSGTGTMGQYLMTLRRDLVAENWDIVKAAPCFVEKAILPNSSPFIFNKEDISVNQIKTSETLLKDETGIPWIVGYYARTSGNQRTEPTATYTPEMPYDIALNDDINTWSYYGYLGKNLINATSFENRVYAWDNIDSRGFNIDYYGPDEPISVSQVPGASYSTYQFYGTPTSATWQNTFKTTYDNEYNNILIAINGVYDISDSTANDIMAQRNKIIKYTDDNGQTYKYKKVHCSRTYITDTKALDTTSIISGYLENMRSHAGLFTGSVQNNTDTIYYAGDGVVLFLEDISVSQITTTIAATRYSCNDQPFDIFAIPYPAADSYVRIWEGEPGNSFYVDCTRSTGWNIVNAMIEQNGTIIKDVQLLPYCPVRSIIQSDGTLSVNGDTKLYSYILQGANEVGYIFNVSSSAFSLEIPIDLSCTNIKIDNQCDFYRFCSPNYNGQFEFNLAKNGGQLYHVEVDCAYKPFNPYIHVAPIFDYLYGQDFDDARGLICNGDFSITQISDAWTQYQINNKNYQAMFDRRIENMEFMNKKANLQSALSVGAGALGAGAALGVAVNPLAGVIGGAVSAAAGIGDIAIQKQVQKETLDYTKDNFGFQLSNIQALPDSITKVDAFNPNNKIFPIIEYYTCTEEEKKAIANKIKYNGMTVGVIGKIEDYLNNFWSYGTIIVSTGDRYMKGQIIRLEGISDDYHYALETANEIYKGVYI